MEIQRLQVAVTEQDLHDLAQKHLPKEVAVEDLEIRLQPEGLRIKGVYHVFMPVSFEALWELGVSQGKPTARLANFRTLGMPANVLKSLIMNVIADAAKKEKWLLVEGDTVRVDVDKMLKEHGLDLATRLTAIRCQAGCLTVEGGSNIFAPPP
jgi:hypothetical protein